MTTEQLASMTDEEKRIRIAELCGWRQTHEQAPGMETDVRFWLKEGRYCQIQHLPDYLNDLNAMHEAEKVLTPEQWETYAFWLAHICELGTYIRATARQRADAFLLTLG